LYIELTELTELPELPSTLDKLFCAGNRLTHISVLPPTLTYFSCANNEDTRRSIFEVGFLKKLYQIYCKQLTENDLKEKTVHLQKVGLSRKI
jgi:Leucine-rich repeat (LRR) protein